MSEPIYDEDTVNLGYLKKAISDTEKNIDDTYKNVSRHYASKPVPPYYKGDTWIDGDIVYVCINTRTIGLYQDADWVTESGAKEEAEKKNKTYLTQPSNYSAGDMWILQSNDDHKAGERGEILISNAGRSEYNEDDWVNMLGYGTIISINEVANNLNDAINRIGNVEEAIEDGLLTTFYQDTIPETIHVGDLWFVTGELENYTKGKIYRYDGTGWKILDDPAIQKAFDEANEARIVADGKIQSFYSATKPTENMGVGDLWIDLANNNQLYRYNGTNWVAVYDTRINELVTSVDTVTERVATIETDLGEIDLKVQETTTTIENVQGKMDDIEQNAVSSVQVMYALGISKTEAPTEGWSVTAPEWAEGMYMWQKTVTIHGDGTVVESDATNISGANGKDGYTPVKGVDYFDGKSAYEIALEEGFEGSEEDWLQSLVGKDGDQGQVGPAGADGSTSYIHIAYSNSEDGSVDFSISDSTNKKYIGQYTDFLLDDSSDYTKYKWTLIKGSDGNQGPIGDTGRGISSIVNYYLATNLSSGVTTSTEGWTTDIQTMTPINKYLWNYDVIKYTDNTEDIGIPIVIGAYGDTGEARYRWDCGQRWS